MTIRLRRTLAVLASVGFAVVLLEAGLRIYNPLRASVWRNQVLLHVRTRIEVPQVGPPPRTTVYTTNSLGFRGPDPPADFGRFLSILAIGGSTTEGFYSDDDRTWPAFLAAKLTSRFQNVWLNNAGISGHSTRGHLILVRDYLPAIQPKVALFLVGLNDIENLEEPDDGDSYNFLFNAPRPTWRQRLLTAAYHSELFGVAITARRRLNATRLSVAYDPHFNISTESHRTMDQAEIAARVEDVRTRMIPPYVRRLEALIRRCRALNVWPVFITQPVLYGEGSDPISGVRLDSLAVSDSNGRMMWSILKEYNSALIATMQRHDVALVDLASELPRRSDIYYDLVHYTDLGNERVADIIAENLNPMLEERFREFRR